MNEPISSLVRLQALDRELDEHKTALALAGPEREKIQADIKDLQVRHEQSKQALTQALVDKKGQELEAEAKEQAIRKNSGELNSVKSNEAYKALLTQIDEAKKAKAAIEDKILELMERIEALQRELKEREKTLQQDKAALEAKSRDLDAREKDLQETVSRKKAERDAFTAALPAAARERYEAVHRGRAGFSAVVAVQGMVCGGCRTTLPANLVNQVMKGKELISCEDCSRILYIVPSEVAAPK